MDKHLNDIFPIDIMKYEIIPYLTISENEVENNYYKLLKEIKMNISKYNYKCSHQGFGRCYTQFYKDYFFGKKVNKLIIGKSSNLW